MTTNIGKDMGAAAPGITLFNVIFQIECKSNWRQLGHIYTKNPRPLTAVANSIFIAKNLTWTGWSGGPTSSERGTKSVLCKWAVTYRGGVGHVKLKPCGAAFLEVIATVADS